MLPGYFICDGFSANFSNLGIGYGRHVQNMINHALTIKDEKEQQECVDAIIAFMGQMNPHLRDVKEFTHKLWDHLHIMSDFKLNVKSPYPIPVFVKADSIIFGIGQP